jgi:hypothetical protein
MNIKTTGAGAAAFILLVVCTMGSPAAESLQRADRYAGRLVADVLRELQRQGAPIIFSTSLVGPDLRVKAEPRRRQGPRELAEDILAPHGLALTNGPRNSWLVVRASKVDAPESSNQMKPPPPESESSPRQDPMRIEEQVDVRERAGDLARSPNVYRVAADKITETAGGLENVFQTLSALPGIAATNDHDARFAVRGGGPEHNSVFSRGCRFTGRSGPPAISVDSKASSTPPPSKAWRSTLPVWTRAMAGGCRLQRCSKRAAARPAGVWQSLDPQA